VLFVLYPLHPIVSTSKLCLLSGSHPVPGRAVLVSKEELTRGRLPCGSASAQVHQPPLLSTEILRSRRTEGASVSDPAQALPWVVNPWRTSGSPGILLSAYHAEEWISPSDREIWHSSRWYTGDWGFLYDQKTPVGFAPQQSAVMPQMGKNQLRSGINTSLQFFGADRCSLGNHCAFLFTSAHLQ